MILQVFSFLSHLQRFTKREYVLISPYYRSIIQVGGAIFLVHGSIILTDGATLLVHGSIILTDGATLLVHGSIILTGGATLLVHGSIFLTGQVHISSEREHIPNRSGSHF